MNTTNTMDLSASYYVLQMNYLGFLVLFWKNNFYKQFLKFNFIIRPKL